MACSCPQGYNFNSTTGLCEKITQQVITNNPIQYQVGKALPGAQYSIHNAYYGDITGIPLPVKIQSTGPQFNLNKFVDNNNVPIPFIGLNNTFYQRLNTVGVWATGPGTTGCGTHGGVNNVCPLNQWIGFPFCLNVPGNTPKTYIFAGGGDNAWRLTIDGQVIVDALDPISYTLDNDFPLQQWSMFSYTLSPGLHTIVAEGYNQHQYASFGVEIYDATVAQLQATNGPAALIPYIVWNTLTPLNASGYFVTGQTSGISCPLGYSLVSQDSTCSQFVCQKLETTSCQNLCQFVIVLTPVPGDCSDDGSITSLVTGGTAPYTYSWNTGATTSGISGVPSGTYTLTVTDADGCVGTTSVGLINPDPILIEPDITIPSCSADDGAISLTVTGGTSPYTFEWTSDASPPYSSIDQDISGLEPGIYTVIVIDANGCTSELSIVVANPCCVPGVNVFQGLSLEVCGPESNGSIAVPIIIGLTYRIVYTVSGSGMGSATVTCGSFSTVLTQNGTFSNFFTADDTTISLSTDSDFDGCIKIDAVVNYTQIQCPDCWKISDCANPNTHFLVTTDLSIYENRVLNGIKLINAGSPQLSIPIDKDTCWYVSKESDCQSVIELIGFNTVFSNCDTCKACPVDPLTDPIPDPDKIYYEIKESPCDVNIMQRLANGYWKEVKRLRYGVSSDCPQDLEYSWLNYQLTELGQLLISGVTCSGKSHHTCWDDLGLSVVTEDNGLYTTLTAGTDIDAKILVYLNPNGKIYPNDPTDLATYQRALGFTKYAVAKGMIGRVLIEGEFAYPSLTTGAIYYADSAGGITTTVPTSGISQVIGIAKSSSVLIVDIKQPIVI